jgi:hypothetical protein
VLEIAIRPRLGSRRASPCRIAAAVSPRANGASRANLAPCRRQRPTPATRERSSKFVSLSNRGLAQLLSAGAATHRACAWEGASRFVKLTGNYVRNAGTVAIGNTSMRAAHMEDLGTAPHVIANNVFESVVPYGGSAIRSAWGATQVVQSQDVRLPPRRTR